MKGKERVGFFLIKAKIYDIELATKVREELELFLKYGLVDINPGQKYKVEILFDAHVYETDDEFYSFPISKERDVIHRRGRKHVPESEIKKNKICNILSEQLDNVNQVFEDAGIDIPYIDIIGEEFFPANSVWVNIYTYEKEQEQGKQRANAYIKVVTPSRKAFYKNLEEAGKWVLEQQSRRQKIEEQIKLQNVPDFVRAEELFAEIARAIYPADRKAAISHKEMLYNTAIKVSDGPLWIKSKSKKDVGDSLDKAAKIDCPEYVIYTQYTTGEWGIKKTEDLKTARESIVKHGYNLKKTCRMIVIHNLKEVPYTLYKETDEGLVMITTEEAQGQKKLHLSWNKQSKRRPGKK